jgi:hypothetical protein
MGSWQTDDKDRSSKLSDALSGRVITWGDRISDAKFGQSSDRTSEEYSQVSREVWSRPGYREKLSSVHKKLWSDSDFKDHQVSLMKSGSGGLHPNYKESLLQSLLDVVEPKAWKFNTGDLVVSGLVPDYYRLDGIKSCVELFGDYWHKDEPEWFREGLYSKAGYKCLIVWERELGKDLDSFNRLVAKLQNFVDSNHGAPLE